MTRALSVDSMFGLAGVVSGGCWWFACAVGFRCWLVADSWFGSGVLWFPLCGLVRFDAIVLRFLVGGCFSFGFGVVGVWVVGLVLW